ncbi:sigma 54-interacting transcriptional regulator [Polycladomyces sp. WAk]|uniref:Sigma 54-interacting transcriptional regulator n=1 Tax=Polycladomyces zharkentensis TaxID=2807616 RepID=A0ABS2WLA0_9BACL|nr:sigma-54-dependent transcriptional regulator [Polycladomyces sp. WAk]MBN2910303.1 sigma 54-interacting transcriptional regulator [Polycladomyces sp. WAk]
MKRKERVFQKLKEWSTDEGMSAGELAERLGLDRANVSYDLNQLWKEGRVEKKPGRPVRFFVKKTEPETVLDRLAKENGSLKTAVEQGKAAILYPPKGMHVLILGETGVGKSMFAECLHQFAIEMKKMEPCAPFITFNCADYSNNPQLLLGQLFGVKEGAYTGATEQCGLIEKADGGVLFLDEIHRLPAEGQEMLFSFIDKGLFRRLGETEVERRANVLLIAATTEDPNSCLLKTFTRRIPMVIHLPPLRERSFEERIRLILKFFQEEAIRLGKEINVSPETIRAFLYYRCPNNVGQLKTDIQLVCAKAYADFVTRKKNRIQIHSTDLPPYVREGLLRSQRTKENIIIHDHPYLFHPDPSHDVFQFSVETGNDTQTVYEKIEKKFSELKSRGIRDEELDALMEMDIENYFTQYFKRVGGKVHQSNSTTIIDPRFIRLARNIADHAEEKLGVAFNRNVLQSLALHIQTSVARIENGESIVHPQLNKMRKAYKKEFDVALDCIRIIEEQLQIDMPIDEAGFLTMFFVFNSKHWDETKEQVQILVITHGTGGATAMVEVTRQLLGTDHAIAIDMPLHAEPEEIFEIAKTKLEKRASSSGVLLLVDMGSLVAFGEMLEAELDIPVKVIPMVSTPHVLEATRKAILGYSLEQLYEDVKQLTPLYTKEKGRNPYSGRTAKWVIITACLTGKGSALAMKQVLKNYLNYDSELLEIIPVNIMEPKEMTRILSDLKRDKKIICMVSNFPYEGQLPHFHLDEVLSLKAIPSIQHLIDLEETYAKMAETLKHHLKHVDPEAVIPDIRDGLERIQSRLGIEIPTNDLIGVVLHASCMLDRLVSGDTSVAFENKESFIRENHALYRTVRDVLKEWEDAYHIQLTDDEICYMMSFFAPYQTLASC